MPSWLSLQQNVTLMSSDEDMIKVMCGKGRRGMGSPFSEIQHLEVHDTTYTVNLKAPGVFYINLKIVMENIAFLLCRWLKK